MNYVAEDVTSIRKAMDKIRAEEEEARRNADPAIACGQFLDEIGRRWGAPRNDGENDYAYRQRVKMAAGTP